jgi:hypothetical protein
LKIIVGLLFFQMQNFCTASAGVWVNRRGGASGAAGNYLPVLVDKNIVPVRVGQ